MVAAHAGRAVHAALHMHNQRFIIANESGQQETPHPCHLWVSAGPARRATNIPKRLPHSERCSSRARQRPCQHPSTQGTPHPALHALRPYKTRPAPRPARRHALKTVCQGRDLSAASRPQNK